MTKQSRFPGSDQQFMQGLLVTDDSAKTIVTASSGNITTQQLNAAETLPVVTQILSVGQKKRVDVLFMFCFLLLNVVFKFKL